MNRDNKIYICANGVCIHPYKEYRSKTLEKNTSIYDKICHKFDETTGFYLESIDTFVTYPMETKYLQALFPDHFIEFVKPNEALHFNDNYNINKDYSLDEIQYELLNRILQSNSRRIFLHLQTGFGKTVILVHLISFIYRTKTLITCHIVRVINQWIDTFKTIAYMPEFRILYINSNTVLSNILNDKLDVSQFDIFISTPDIFISYGKNNSWDKLSIITRKMGVGLHVIDEAHRRMGQIVKLNSLLNIERAIYLSADFKQSNYFRDTQFRNMHKFTKIIRPEADTMFNLRFIQAMVIYYDSKPSFDQIATMFGKRGFIFNEFMKYELSKPFLMIVIKKVLKTIFSSKSKEDVILILAWNIDNTDTIYNDMKIEYPDIKIGRCHSYVDSIEKNDTLDNAELIVSTYFSFFEGTDLKERKIRYILSLEQINMVADNQTAGRARRKEDQDSYYFMFIDKGIPYCTNKLTERLNYLKKTKIKKINHLNYY